jgi:hypothetical protein
MRARQAGWRPGARAAAAQAERAGGARAQGVLEARAAVAGVVGGSARFGRRCSGARVLVGDWSGADERRRREWARRGQCQSGSSASWRRGARAWRCWWQTQAHARWSSARLGASARDVGTGVCGHWCWVSAGAGQEQALEQARRRCRRRRRVSAGAGPERRRTARNEQWRAGRIQTRESQRDAGQGRARFGRARMEVRCGGSGPTRTKGNEAAHDDNLARMAAGDLRCGKAEASAGPATGGRRVTMQGNGVQDGSI